jgi:two-component system cell cycle sensor histidine kinase/response regulator CckA
MSVGDHGARSVLFVSGAGPAVLAPGLGSGAEGVAFRLEQKTVPDGPAALEALAYEASLAVVDMTLAGMRGAEGWRKVRDRWSRPLIVVCSDDDDAGSRAALADGAEEAIRSGDSAASALLQCAIGRGLARGRDVRPEVQLRDLEDKWGALNAANPFYVMEIDHQDRITYLNRSAAQTLPVEAFLGQSVFAFTYPDAHAEVRARLEHVRRTGEAVTVEERAHRTLGDDHWFVARCLPVKRDGEVTSVLVLTEDVSERHRMQQLLANSERRFRAMVEKSTDVITLLDRAGFVLYASPATSEVLGLTPEELVGRDFTLLLHPEDARGVLEARKSLHAVPGRRLSKDVRVRHKDGTWRLVHGTGTNLLDDPAVGAVVGNYRDITAQREIEEQLRCAQQWEAIGLLSGGIAHDFNNLLCVITAAASAAAASLVPGSPEAAAIDDVNEAATRAAELTRKLLTLGRKQPLTMEYLDAGDIVADFASLIRRSLGDEIEVAVSREGPLPVHVDRLQIEQVLLNVCTNARQAIQGRGRVRIVGRSRLGSANGAGGDERVVEISVHDDGPGMDEATRGRVFDPFFTTKRDGSGLGLTVSYGIVERHGGSMRIDSEPGRGTVVTVQLPALEGPRKEVSRREAAPAGGSGHPRILVAEDEPSLRRIFSRVLRGGGYEVIEVEDGDAAVARFAADDGTLALVILDIRMPGLSGPAAYERMARERPDLPVLFVTGHAPDSVEIPRRSSLLVKPFTTDALLRAVARATGAAQEVAPA